MNHTFKYSVHLKVQGLAHNVINHIEHDRQDLNQGILADIAMMVMKTKQNKTKQDLFRLKSIFLTSNQFVVLEILL